MATENELVLCRRALMEQAVSPKSDPLEKKAALFYLGALKDFDTKLLHNQGRFRRGIGGTGDNMVFMPLVERENDKALLDEEGNVQATKCVFDDFKTYLAYIQTSKGVRHDMHYRRILPRDLNALPVEDYVAIFNRQRGLSDYSL